MTDSTRMESIQRVLLLKDRYDKFSASPSAGFNVFSVLDIGETNHSAFLANLLNPNGSHRRGAVFLKHFLNLRRSELSTYGDLEGFHVDNPSWSVSLLRQRHTYNTNSGRS